jgi:hypothetical protein
MTNHLIDLAEPAGEGRADPTVDRDERRVRAMVDALEGKTGSNADLDIKVRTAALRTILDYGEIAAEPAESVDQG